jgi:hypothetical protein
LVREHLDFSIREEVHDHVAALFTGQQPRDLHMLAFACFGALRLSHCRFKCFLLVSPLAGMVEEVLQYLGRCPSTSQAFIVLMVAEQF